MMILPPPFLDAPHRELKEFQERTDTKLMCALVKGVVG